MLGPIELNVCMLTIQRFLSKMSFFAYRIQDGCQAATFGFSAVASVHDKSNL
jgi:hypothetical protein